MGDTNGGLGRTRTSSNRTRYDGYLVSANERNMIHPKSPLIPDSASKIWFVCVAQTFLKAYRVWVLSTESQHVGRLIHLGKNSVGIVGRSGDGLFPHLTISCTRNFQCNIFFRDGDAHIHTIFLFFPPPQSNFPHGDARKTRKGAVRSSKNVALYLLYQTQQKYISIY